MLIFLVVLAGIGLWAVSAYNGLVSLKNKADESWRQIDVQLKRRHDLVPNLVETVRGAMDYEKSTLEAVVAARTHAMAATTPGASATAEAELTQALGKLLAVVESYPDLKANQNVLRLQEELSNTENLVGFARQHYNDVVRQLNTRRESFPGNLIAQRFGFAAREYFAAEAADHAVPRVDLRGGAASGPRAGSTPGGGNVPSGGGGAAA